MKGREQTIYNRIAATRDPVEKQALRAKLTEIQNLYYYREIRTEFIKKNNPKYAAAVKASENSEAPTASDTDSPSSWEGLSKEDKTSMCKQILDQCNKNKDLYYCRFVVTKCRNYISSEEYEELVKNFRKRQ